MATTLEEKQKELDALQSAFDEYIASSRELERELEEELESCQNDLTKSESRNAALSNQLANIQPQLTSLETKSSALTVRLTSETERRIASETKTEEAENRLRQTEGALAAMRSKSNAEVGKLQGENEELCERLAFLEGEAQECRDELNKERERHREEVEVLRGDVSLLETRLKERDAEKLELMEQVATGIAMGMRDVADKRNHEGNDNDNIVNGEEKMMVSESAVKEQKPSPPLPPPAATESETGASNEQVRKLHREEVEEPRGDLNLLETRLKERDAEKLELMEEVDVDIAMSMRDVAVEGNQVGNGDDNIVNGKDKMMVSASAVEEQKPSPPLPPPAATEPGTGSRNEREEYIRKLEEELEIVTKQFIQAQGELSQIQAELNEKTSVEAEQRAHIESLEESGSSADNNAAPFADVYHRNTMKEQIVRKEGRDSTIFDEE
eukprot:CAMPEP_0181131840 /NCGR_PEP_ID=MMETSP1071-20121207/30672_1 /TAXON_ID=35127 /ORGANISM="Thalassiosira sp., Strain NH16" /LENGTH=440 /DNA_ID=CAMNT_0023218125 /DNA_START=55 /DNA_END=1378 /DNA_ORIENTATION=+